MFKMNQNFSEDILVWLKSSDIKYLAGKYFYFLYYLKKKSSYVKYVKISSYINDWARIRLNYLFFLYRVLGATMRQEGLKNSGQSTECYFIHPKVKS